MAREITYYRVTDAPRFMGSDSFTHEGDTIAVISHPDTDSVFNLSTGSNYTYGGEQGMVISDISQHPLFDNERFNLQAWRNQGIL